VTARVPPLDEEPRWAASNRRQYGYLLRMADIAALIADALSTSSGTMSAVRHAEQYCSRVRSMMQPVSLGGKWRPEPDSASVS
jgi:hypothetical protein